MTHLLFNVTTCLSLQENRHKGESSLIPVELETLR